MKYVRRAVITALVVIALLGVVAMYITYPYAFIIEWRLGSVGAADVIREADSLFGKYPPSEDGYTSLKADEIPPYIADLKPSEVVVAQDGVYIRCGSFHSRDWGVFVPAPDSSFAAAPGSDPSFEMISDRVFLYGPKGWKYW